TQLGNAEILRVEGFAGAERGDRRFADIRGRDFVGLAEPERQNVGIAHARVGNLANLRGDEPAHAIARGEVETWSGSAVVHRLRGSARTGAHMSTASGPKPS